ncbi:transmembrane protein [Babesia ovis]|uniref:Transmembrane protein n=1 Tax=Babesia ovis TaxID=5869 RepID=A0A9W5WU66_BABOV|nr:transmembrane protein [Babesia ovis]
MAAANKSSDAHHPVSYFGVDLTRCLDSACMAIFTLLISCGFLFMFGETLRMIDRTSFSREEYVKRFLNRIFPFRTGFDFNLTHALLFSICTLMLCFRGESHHGAEGKHAKSH